MHQPLDIVGIGVGPFNLSLAALLHRVEDITCRFLERRKQPVWHPGLLFKEAEVQVSFLKDLVTLADPTNPFSFLSFLAEHARLYRFVTAEFPRVERREFDQYLQWVCSRLKSVTLGCPVNKISFNDGVFEILTPSEKIHAHNVSVGPGRKLHIPKFAEPHLGPDVFHASRFLLQRPELEGRAVAVVGGGQTGAEIIEQLLNSDKPPRFITWLSRRDNFLPLDDSPFTNEYFFPQYANYFYDLPHRRKTEMIEEHKLASDGISGHLLRSIYRTLYRLEFVEGCRPFRLMPRHKVTSLAQTDEGYTLRATHLDSGQEVDVATDVAILATGTTDVALSSVPGIEQLIRRGRDGTLSYRRDFSVEWEGPAANRIFIMNGARHQRGIADPNLSLTAWRSSMIINSLTGRTVYQVDGGPTSIAWLRHGFPSPDNGERG